MGTFSYIGILSLCVTFAFTAPVQNENVAELKEKLQSLHDVLQQLHDEISTIEDKRSMGLETRSEQVLENFESQLSAEDQALLQKMKSKVHYLQTSLDQTTHPDPADVADASTDKRGVDPQIKALFSQLSAEDQKLLRAHTSKMEALQKAYDELAHAQTEQQREEAQMETGEKESVLDTVKLKFDTLKDAMTHKKGDNSQRSQDEIAELKANLFEEVSNAKQSGYNQNEILKAISQRKARDVESEINDDDAKLNRLFM